MPSAVIKDHSYDPKSRMLFITFPKRDVYAYAEVEPETYQAMEQALSRGRFFMRYIRDFYPYGEVVDPSKVELRPAKRDRASRPPLPRLRSRRKNPPSDPASPPP